MNVSFFSLTDAKPRKYGLQCLLRGDFAAGDFGEGGEAVAEVLRHEVGGEFAGEAALRDSKSFRLGDLGSFRPTIEANKGCEKAEDVDASCIKAVHVRFTPSAYMERKLKTDAEGMTFVKVE